MGRRGEVRADAVREHGGRREAVPSQGDRHAARGGAVDGGADRAADVVAVLGVFGPQRRDRPAGGYGRDRAARQIFAPRAGLSRAARARPRRPERAVPAEEPGHEGRRQDVRAHRVSRPAPATRARAATAPGAVLRPRGGCAAGLRRLSRCALPARGRGAPQSPRDCSPGLLRLDRGSGCSVRSKLDSRRALGGCRPTR